MPCVYFSFCLNAFLSCVQVFVCTFTALRVAQTYHSFLQSSSRLILLRPALGITWTFYYIWSLSSVFLSFCLSVILPFCLSSSRLIFTKTCAAHYLPLCHHLQSFVFLSFCLSDFLSYFVCVFLPFFHYLPINFLSTFVYISGAQADD